MKRPAQFAVRSYTFPDAKEVYSTKKHYLCTKLNVPFVIRYIVETLVFYSAHIYNSKILSICHNDNFRFIVQLRPHKPA